MAQKGVGGEPETDDGFGSSFHRDSISPGCVFAIDNRLVVQLISF